MSKLTKVQRSIVTELVQSACTWNLTIEEGLLYVNSRLNQINVKDGKKAVSIGRRYFQTLKAQVDSDEDTEVWLWHFAKSGFAKAHRDRHAEILESQNELKRLLFEELGKDDKNETLILKFMERLESHNIRLEQLSMGAPIVAKMEVLLREAKIDPSKANLLMERFTVTLDSNMKRIMEAEKKLEYDE